MGGRRRGGGRLRLMKPVALFRDNLIRKEKVSNDMWNSHNLRWTYALLCGRTHSMRTWAVRPCRALAFVSADLSFYNESIHARGLCPNYSSSYHISQKRERYYGWEGRGKKVRNYYIPPDRFLGIAEVGCLCSLPAASVSWIRRVKWPQFIFLLSRHYIDSL